MSTEPALPAVPLISVDGAEAEAFLAATVDANAPQLLQIATRSIVRLLGERGSCILFDGQPRVAFATGEDDRRGFGVDVRKYPEIHLAIEQRSIIAVEDVHNDARMQSVRSSLPPNVKTVAVVPLVVKDRCLGVVLAQSSRRQRLEPEALATASLLGKLTARLLPANAEVREREVFPRPVLLERSPRAVPAEDARRVLIIDDDEDASFLVSALLTRVGYDVTLAIDGESGFQAALTRRPGLILLDVNMPKLDGYGVAQLLNDDLLTRYIPIVFVSASKDLMSRVRELRIDVVDFMAKPFDCQELLARIDHSFVQAEAHRRARLEANLDELTGLGNLRSLRARLAVEQARWNRHGTPVAIVMADVDKLKRINDTLGHAAGSVALAAIAKVLLDAMRETDLAFRYGGDEFVLLLPHATLAEGKLFAERVLENIRALRCNGASVSVSIGVAALDADAVGCGDRVPSIDGVLEQADAAAYEAKREGGDRVHIYAAENASVTARK
jgi:two-component system, cell cycle response regulator